MLTIKKIAIENSRGICLPVTVDSVKSGKTTSTLIYGRNGTGESSIVDAWERLLNFNIENLRREGISANDFPRNNLLI